MGAGHCFAGVRREGGREIPGTPDGFEGCAALLTVFWAPSKAKAVIRPGLNFTAAEADPTSIRPVWKKIETGAHSITTHFGTAHPELI